MCAFRKDKELLKSMETPQEKRARRLAKKEAKERKRRKDMGWDEDYLVKIAAFPQFTFISWFLYLCRDYRPRLVLPSRGGGHDLSVCIKD